MSQKYWSRNRGGERGLGVGNLEEKRARAKERLRETGFSTCWENPQTTLANMSPSRKKATMREPTKKGGNRD